MANAIRVIVPYDYFGAWVFDDPAVDLVRESCRVGTAHHDEPSDVRKTVGGAHPTKLRSWYRTANPDAEGWLCPALFKYFDQAPPEIYVRAEPKTKP